MDVYKARNGMVQYMRCSRSVLCKNAFYIGEHLVASTSRISFKENDQGLPFRKKRFVEEYLYI